MTRSLASLLIIIAAAHLAAPSAHAQSGDAGPRINMTIGAPTRAVARDTTHAAVGTFARQAADTLVLHRAAGASDTTLFLRDLARVDEQVHPFNTAGTRQGAIIGGVIGLVAGVLVIEKARRDCSNSTLQSVTTDVSCVVNYGALPSFVGAGAGIGFGVTWVSEAPRWQVRWSAPLP